MDPMTLPGDPFESAPRGWVIMNNTFYDCRTQKEKDRDDQIPWTLGGEDPRPAWRLSEALEAEDKRIRDEIKPILLRNIFDFNRPGVEGQ